MIPLALRITNFRSVRGTQTFYFPSKPGLYFMQGINEEEPRLEANGAGKTTIWEALTWCWHGKTSKGLKAGEVCNWQAGKGTEVAFIFLTENGQPMKMARTWSPNSWTLAYDDEMQEEPNKQIIDLTKEKDNPAFSWLPLDFEQWLNCVLTAQNQPMFLDMKREAQATLFSTVVGADRWLDYSSRSSKLAGDRDRDVRSLERDLSNLQGELSATDRKDYREESERWEKKTAEMIAEIETGHSEMLTKRKRLKQELEDAQAREEKARDALKSERVDPELMKKYEALRAEEDLIAGNMARKQGSYDRLHQDMDRLEEQVRCPTCGQEMDREHRRSSLRALEAELRSLNETIELCKRRKLEVSIAREDAASILRVQDLRESKAREELDEAQRAVANARRALDQCDRDLDRLEDDHERLQKERNPYADMEARAQEDARKLRGRIKELQYRIDSASSQQALFQFWVRGFKDVRLMKINEALSELEVEVNSGVDALGLLGWELLFAVDRETKAGKIERGFNCFVKSPHNELAVPWEAWSGGEAQRLRLAGTMGLADLIRSRTGASIPLEVWDEPTAGLSAQGIRDLLDCLQERAMREKRCIWIVDHRSHDYGGFAGSCIVRKTTRGTVIENGIDRA